MALSGTTLAAAESVAQRVRGRLTAAELVLANGKAMHLCVSVGIAGISSSSQATFAQLVQQADTALTQEHERNGDYALHSVS